MGRIRYRKSTFKTGDLLKIKSDDCFKGTYICAYSLDDWSFLFSISHSDVMTFIRSELNENIIVLEKELNENLIVLVKEQIVFVVGEYVELFQS